MTKLFTRLLAGAAFIATPALAQTVNVGFTGALTGPASSTYAPVAEGLRIYVDRLNAAGGVNGVKIKLTILDDSAQPTKAVANIKQLLSEDAHILLNSSLSSTFGPMTQEAEKANIPALFAGAVCPKEVYPPASPMLFCSTAFAARYDSQISLALMKEKGMGNKLGFAGMAIPVSRIEIDYAEGIAKDYGLEVVGKEIIPPPTPDFTPFATKLNEAKANWVFSWMPWGGQIKTLDALRKLGWAGGFVTIAHVEAEGELARINDEKLFVVGANSFFNENKPIHQEITAAAKAAGSSTNPNLMTEGWIAGLVLEAAIKKAGGDGKKLKDAMENLDVDTKGLRGQNIVWTKDNHFRTKQSYRIFNYVGGKINTVKDWQSFDVK